MVYRVKSLRDVQLHKACTDRWLLLIETICSSRDDWEKSSSGRAERPKAMLGRREMKIRRTDVREKKTFKNFNRRGKKGDGTIRGTKVKGFAGFRDRDDMGGFPNGREVSMVNGEVEELSQV